MTKRRAPWLISSAAVLAIAAGCSWMNYVGRSAVEALLLNPHLNEQVVGEVARTITSGMELSTISLSQKKELVETWRGAMQVAVTIRNSGKMIEQPTLTATIPDIRIEPVSDPWSHPFCVLRRGHTIMVASAGTSGTAACDSLREPLPEPRPAKLVRLHSGALLLSLRDQTP
jgi:hypothetical protein